MHKLIYAFLLIICLSSFAFAEVRMNSLGDYFHYLVPDVETDIEVFPTHLNFLEQRNIMLEASRNYPPKKIGLNVYPLLGKISYGMKTSFASRGKSYSSYENYKSDYYYSLSKDSEFDIKNFLSLQLNNSFYIGMKFNWEKGWVTGDSESEATHRPDYDYYSKKSHYKEMDDDTYSTGFNIHFGNIIRKDISLSYSKNDYNKLDNSEHIYDREYSSGKRRYDSSLSNQSKNSDTEEYRFDVLFEKIQMRKFNRLYLSALYHIEDDITDYYREDDDRSYYNDTLSSSKWVYSKETTTTKNRYYQTEIGWGQNWIRDNLQLFYGIRFQGSYSNTKTDETEESVIISYETFNDSTCTDTTSFEDALFDIEDKEWQASIILPFGMEYKLTNYFTLYAGLGYKITRKLVDYPNSNKFYYWGTGGYQSAGIKIKPIKNLELGLNLNGDLAHFKNWRVEVRYLF